MNDTTRYAVEGRLRRGIRSGNMKYQWDSIRKSMSAAEYQMYLRKLHPQIYADFLAAGTQHPEMSKKCIIANLAQKYDYSESHIWRIVRDQAKGVTEPQPTEVSRQEGISERERIYRIVLAKQNEFPMLQTRSVLKMVTKEQHLSYRTVESYYYYYHKLMQQERNPAPEQIDEAV